MNTDFFRAKLNVLGIETRPIEQLDDDSSKPGNVMLDTGEIGVLQVGQGAGDAIEHVFSKTPNRRHGSPQLVRDDGEKRRSTVIMLLELRVGARQLFGP